MRQGCKEAWITVVNHDDSVFSALALAQSIRETCSFKDILALYEPKISPSKRNLLIEGFDQIFPVRFEGLNDEEWNIYAKIFCWSITSYHKLVFLDYKSLVLKNCDELFEKEGFAIQHTNSIEEIAAMSLIPSIADFHELETKHGFAVGGTKDVSLEKLCRQAGFIELELSYFYGQTQNGEIFNCRPSVVVFEANLTSDIINGVVNVGSDSESYFQKFTEYRIAVAQKALNNISGFRANKILPGKPTKEPIAIVGMSFRLPGANNAEEFWNLMMSHGDAMQGVPTNRWTPEQSCLIDTEDRKLKGGYLKSPIDEFDGIFFGISPAVLSFVDPQQRIILEMAWEALEDAAILPSSLEGTNTGVFTGQWRFDYQELLLESGFQGNDFYRPYMGNSDGMTASRIAHFFGLSGRNIAVENGCSSSVVAIGLAAQSLQNNESKIALAGGVNLLVKPYNYESLKHLISKDGHCKPFEASANGYARSEGCAVFVLKRMSDAVKDNDRVYALIKGYGVSQEGLSNSLGTPTVQCEAAAMKMALADAGVQPHEVTFVEAHGTGTAVGDPLEVKAIASVYGQQRTNNLVIGSVKANVGHTESCSGITGIIKTVLAFEHELIPPQRQLKKLNPEINLLEIPAIIPLEPVIWKKDSSRPRIAGVSCFGITGTDTHVILQEPPVRDDILKLLAPKDTLNVLTVSAKTQDSLNILLNNYFNYLQKSPYNIHDVAYTANTGRTHFKYRAAILSRSLKEVSDSILNNQILKGSCEKKPNICFLFPGQGWEYQKMGKTLYSNNELFRVNIDMCERIIKSKTGRSIKDAMWSETSIKRSTIVSTELSIFTIQYCLVKLWKSLGVKPDCILGINVGEYAAATFAEILTVEDAVMLIEARCKFLIKMPYGKVIVVNENEAKATQLVKEFQETTKGYLETAKIISLQQTTLLGSDESIIKFRDFCNKNGITAKILEEKIAFYTNNADTLLEEFKRTASAVTYSTPKCNYISSVLGVCVDTVDAEYWVNHLTEKVFFHDATQTASSLGCNLFLELGSYPLLSESISANSSLSYVESIKRDSDEHETLIKSLAKLYIEGVDIAWSEFDNGKQCNKVPLPHYPFQKNKYWFDYKATTSAKQLPFHPLVGHCLQTPGVDAIYQNNFQLQNHSYIEDHKVGDSIIYPGSAFLEMTLMAGHASKFSDIKMFQLPETPLIINKFLIITALEVQPDKTLEFYTIAAESKDNSIKNVKIFCRKRTLPELPWVEHSEGSFVIEEAGLEKNIEISLKHIKIDMTLISEKTLYTDLSELGYNFGSKFQSLKNIWRNDSGVLAEVLIPQEDIKQSHGYLCHPIATDAMIQSSLIALSEKFDCLHLPISIQKFVFYKTPKEGQKYYIYTKKNSKDTFKTVLINEVGNVFCSMNGVGFAKTTVTEFQKRFKAKNNQDLPIFTEEWDCIPTNPLNQLKPFLQQNEAELNLLMESTEELIEVTEERQRLNLFISMKTLSLLLTMGWTCPILDDTIYTDKIIKDLGIVENGRWLVGRFLEMLTEDGYLEKLMTNSGDFKVIKAFPSETNLNLIVSDNIGGYQTGVFEHEWACALTFLSNMPQLLVGTVLPLPLLFPEDETEFSAEHLYSESAVFFEMGNSLCRAVEFFLNKIIENPKFENETIKLLEIGSGTGGQTKLLLPSLSEIGINFVYTFTDISKAFLPAARKQFEEYANNMEYLTLNIEEDPKLQGFNSNDYDVVISSYALHATKNLSETCRNVRNLIKNNGMFFMTDTIVPQRYLDISFGFLEGYYGYADIDIRPNHCLISAENWINLLLSSGFTSTCTFKRSADEHGLIVSEASTVKPQYKLPSHVPKKTWIVFHDGSEISDTIIKELQIEDRKVFAAHESHLCTIRSQFSINLRFNSKQDFQELYKHVASESNITNLEGVLFLWSLKNIDDFSLMPQSLLYVLQTTLENITQNPPSIYVVTKGQINVQDQESTISTSSAIFGMVKSFMSENSMFECKIIDLDSSQQKTENINGNMLWREIWKRDQEKIVAFRGTNRYVPRLTVLENNTYLPPLTLPLSSTFQLELPKSNQIDDLKFTSQIKTLIADNEVLVEVKAAALNFKDILNVLKPSEEFGDFVGSDFSGIVTELGKNVTNWNIGDRVIGGTFHSGTICSHVALSEEHLISIPENMSYAECATLPTVFATAYHCLVNVAQIKAGDNVLIHTGSGGVGLCAIEICMKVGANIFTTASTKRKQTYLKNLGINQVFSSRNLDFSKIILDATGNKGVNIIINTLSGPGFKEASLDCCAVNGRFIEISKLNVWSSSEVSQFRKDVKYSIEDLSVVDFVTWKDILATLKTYLKNKRINPIAFTQFCFLDIRRALKYLEKARQIGKVVCVMPHIAQTNNALQITPMLFNDKGTYLITGGTRGIGFVVAKWMLKFGAKHILLCSRSIAKSQISKEIEEINSKGNNVVVKQCDISNFEQCDGLLKYITEEMPKLRGIMHSAGVLSDGVIQNLTWQNFEATMNPKIKGAWNLHCLTKSLPLEHFIMFSSIAAIIGSPGQSTHSAANAFLDAFAHYRRSIGLPATSVNWGQWGETGIVANKTIYKGVLNPFTNAQGLQALTNIITLHLTQAMAFDADLEIIRDDSPWTKLYLERIQSSDKSDTKKKNSTNKVSTAEFWNEINKKNDANIRYEIVLRNVLKVIKNTLKYNKQEEIKIDGDFRELGVDSLMMIEIRNHLQTLIGTQFVISGNDVANTSTIEMLARKIMQILFVL